MAEPVIITVHAIVQNILEYLRGFMAHLYRISPSIQSAFYGPIYLFGLSTCLQLPADIPAVSDCLPQGPVFFTVLV
jgi:hypothetical protein